jgi:hypothetical protein
MGKPRVRFASSVRVEWRLCGENLVDLNVPCWPEDDSRPEAVHHECLLRDDSFTIRMVSSMGHKRIEKQRTMQDKADRTLLHAE